MHEPPRPLSRSRRVWLLAAAGAGLAVAAALWGLGPRGGPTRTVVMPALSPIAQAGMAEFARRCGACHGPRGEGTASGPPLVHPIYRPGHHADEAFLLAVQRGVRAHHWRFGDMSPQPEVDVDEARRMVLYVRELQRANGIN